ncbi:MAG: diguanylate cyclase [Clostridium sp.]
MIRIQKALSSGLRIGDVISRLSNNQFIVLLLNCKREDCTMVFDRVLRKVQYSLNNKKFFIDVDVEEVMPQEKVLNMN